MLDRRRQVERQRLLAQHGVPWATRSSAIIDVERRRCAHDDGVARHGLRSARDAKRTPRTMCPRGQGFGCRCGPLDRRRRRPRRRSPARSLRTPGCTTARSRRRRSSAKRRLPLMREPPDLVVGRSRAIARADAIDVSVRRRRSFHGSTSTRVEVLVRAGEPFRRVVDRFAAGERERPPAVAERPLVGEDCARERGLLDVAGRRRDAVLAQGAARVVGAAGDQPRVDEQRDTSSRRARRRTRAAGSRRPATPASRPSRRRRHRDDGRRRRPSSLAELRRAPPRPGSSLIR